MMLPALAHIKERLYSIIREASCPDAQIEQSLKLSTKGNEKVQVIQVQAVSQVVITGILEAIKEIEQLSPVDFVSEDMNPVELACKWLFEQSYSFNDAQQEIKRAYLKHAISISGSNKEAAEMIGVRDNRLSYLKAQHGIKTRTGLV